MMIALYSVGNVKRELKKVGRKLYIRDFAKFIFAYIEEDKLSLLTVQKITDDRWQIIHFYAEKIDLHLCGRGVDFGSLCWREQISSKTRVHRNRRKQAVIPQRHGERCGNSRGCAAGR